MSAHPRLLEWGGLGALFALWVVFFAPVFDPFLNADHAIHVMMASHFSFDHSLYYWGQDRLGSLLPLLSYPLATLIHPLWAVSIVQAFLLMATWYFWSRFISRDWLRVLLALLLLFPPVFFGALVDIGQPYTPQLMLWGAAFCLYRRNTDSAPVLFVSFLLLMLSVWVSETSWGALMVFVGWVIYRDINRTEEPVKKPVILFLQRRIVPMLAAFVPGLMLILAAKKNSTRIPEYSEQMFNTPGELMTLLKEMSVNMSNYLVDLNVNSPLQWPGIVLLGLAFLALLCLPLFLGDMRKDRKTILLLLWCLIVIQLTGILAAHWTLMIDYRSRLFSHVFFLLVFVLLLYADQITNANWRKAVAIGLVIMGLSLGGWHLYLSVNQMTSRGLGNTLAMDARDFPVQENTTFIGNYWYVYLLGAYHPDNVNYLPHEGDYVRYSGFRDGAFEANQVVLIANDWLKNFPEEIVQYGEVLHKSGTPQMYGSYTYCTYTLHERQ